jgi:hypothetical protein
MARLRISLQRGAAIHVKRISVGKQKLAYILLADKKMQYQHGRSRVVYIGTTKTGVKRVAESVAARANEIFKQWGVQEFDARIVTCPGRRGPGKVKAWHKLERALLLVFRDLYGQVPLCNGTGHKMKEAGEFTLFSESRLRNIIADLS